MAVFTDNFNRANGAPGANWTVVNGGTWEIFSNELRQTQTASVYRGIRWNGGAFDSNNLYVRATCRALDGFSGFGVLVRCPTTGTNAAALDGYGLVGFPGEGWYLIVFTDADEQSVTSLGGTVATNTNYTLEIRANGSTITAFVNGSQVGQITNTQYATGGAMLVSFGYNNYYDNFEAGDIETGRTGTVSMVQAGQSIAASSSVRVAGSGGLVEANATVVANAAVLCVGTSSLSQHSNVVVSTGIIPIYGTGNTESQQVLSGEGVAYINGITNAVVDPQDVVSFGIIELVGVSNLQQADQSADALTSVEIFGSSTLFQEQEVAVSGAVRVNGQIALSEENHNLASQGEIGFPVVIGQGNLIQAEHDLESVANISAVGEGNLLVRPDSLASFTTVYVTGISEKTSENTINVNGTVTINGTVALQQFSFIVQTTGEIITSGIVQVLQETNIASGVGNVNVSGNAENEQQNIVFVAGQIEIQGELNVAQQENTLLSLGGTGSLPISGTANLFQDSNLLNGQGDSVISGFLIAQEYHAGIVSNASVRVQGNSAIVQQVEYIDTTGFVLIGGTGLGIQNNIIDGFTRVRVSGNVESESSPDVFVAIGVLDLIYAVVYGIIKGPGSSGKVTGNSFVGSVHGTGSIGSI